MATEDSTTPPATIDWSSAPDQLRSAHDAAKADAAAARAAAETIQRENAMLKAGVDSEHPAFSYFNAGYQGELTSDDIKAEWAKITGGTQAPTPPATEPQTPGVPSPPAQNPEVEAALRGLQQERERLTGGAVAPGQEPSPDPMDTALATFHNARKQGDNTPQAMRKAFQIMFDAAAAGDERIAFSDAKSQMDHWKQRHGEDVW